MMTLITSFPRKQESIRYIMDSCLRGNDIILLLLIFLAVCNVAAAADDPKVTSAIDRSSVKIGDHITYTITVTGGKDTEVELPKFEGSVGNLQIRDSDYKEKKSFGKKTITQRLILASYEPGRYTIPRFTVKYKMPGEENWHEAQTSEAAVEVKSVLADAKGVLDIRDIKGPVEMRGASPGILILLGALAVSALLVWGVVSFIHKRNTAKEPPKSPHVIAYEALDALLKKDLIRQGKIKEYYIALSDIVRHYLENRFNLRAPEMTTEEFLIKARDNKDLSDGPKILLKDFMSHCDLVKFARYGPTGEEIDQSNASARRLIDQTKQEEKAA